MPASEERNVWRIETTVGAVIHVNLAAYHVGDIDFPALFDRLRDHGHFNHRIRGLRREYALDAAYYPPRSI